MEQVVPSATFIGGRILKMVIYSSKRFLSNNTVSSIQDLRVPYKSKIDVFTEDKLASLNPMEQFKAWFDQVRQEGLMREPNAMCLSTVGKDGQPSSRFVLLKGFSNDGFKFFTNSLSRKGREMEGNNKVCLAFYWDAHHRQVRVEGHVQMLADIEAEEYFHSRPFESQVGSAASEQSSVVPNREFLSDKFNQLKESCEGDQRVPKPPEWKGYLVIPRMIEFWQGQSDRLHDRIVFRKPVPDEVPDGINTKNASNGWVFERLAP